MGLLELVNYAVLQYDIEMGFFRYPGIDFNTGIAATAILVVAGSFAGLIPAIKAAASALRQERQNSQARELTKAAIVHPLKYYGTDFGPGSTTT